jgi:hypothetical protein
MDVAALRRWWPLAAVLGLLFVTALAATWSAPQLTQLTPDAEPTPAARPPLLPAQPTVTPAGAEGGTTPSAEGLPGWIGTVAIIVLSLAGLALIGLVVWALVRDQMRRNARKGGRRGAAEAAVPNTADDLVAALDAGLEELSDTDRDPRRAVIACWVRLEQAAAAAGTTRLPGDSPTDLVGRLLAEQRVDARVLAALLAVYREARYATHTVDDQMRAQAVSALQQLRADLGAVGAR